MLLWHTVSSVCKLINLSNFVYMGAHTRVYVFVYNYNIVCTRAGHVPSDVRSIIATCKRAHAIRHASAPSPATVAVVAHSDCIKTIHQPALSQTVKVQTAINDTNKGTVKHVTANTRACSHCSASVFFMVVPPPPPLLMSGASGTTLLPLPEPALPLAAGPSVTHGPWSRRYRK